MSYDSNFERLKTALFRGQPDRVPLFELAVAQNVRESFLGRKIVTIGDEIDFARKAGYDYIKVSPIIELNPDKILPKEGRRLSSVSHSDHQREWHSSSQGLITSLADFEKFHWPKLNDIDYSPFERFSEKLPSDMQIVAQYGDIFTWVWDFMGFETFSYALVENEELVTMMFETIGSIEIDIFKTAAEFDRVGAIFYSDDIAINSGLFVSPAVLRKYLFPWMKKIGNICKEKEIPFIYHSDGVLWDVFDDLKECGVNAIHPIEPQAMDIVEVKKKVGDAFCVIGNVDVDLLARGTTQQVEDYVKMLLSDVAPGGGYCLGSGNSIPEYVNTENYKVMVETVHQLGSYGFGGVR
ncbi:MAG: uroporphyrinogen decarboxylase family protein [candidate division KSB1 bacterium]|jgi:uroporphyrinogen decarboxylase|nr:uroporphyrinogen decarboxylase family protein [candidate division KSB1 bacterium]